MKQVSKQITSNQRKIDSAKILLTEVEGKEKRAKIQAKIAALKGVITTLKSLKKQLDDCKKSKLSFSLFGTPQFLTGPSLDTTNPRTVYQMGFLFRNPKGYQGSKFCVVVNGSRPGGGECQDICYPDNQRVEVNASIWCRKFAGVDGCLSGLDSEDRIIGLTAGNVQELNGNCAFPTTCSIALAMQSVTTYYANASLTSLSAGPCT